MSPRRRRVLYVNHVSELGGAERSLLVLLSALDREAIEPVLAAPPGELLDQAAALGVEVHPIAFGRVRRRVSRLGQVKSVARLMQAGWSLRPLIVGASMVHANSTAAALAVAFGRLLAARRPMVWHVRDLSFPPGAVRLLARQVDRVIAISRAVGDKLSRDGVPPRKLSVLANALNARWYENEPWWDELRAELGVDHRPPEEVPLIAVIAQLVPWKGHRILLEAFARVRRRYPEARLLVIGDDLYGEHPDYVDELRARAEEPDLAGHVLWLGFRTDIPALLHISELLVLPSHGEPFGRVLLEAMAACKPVVATARGGTPDIVKHGVTGLLVPDHDVGALAAAMIRVLGWRPEQRAWVGTAGRALLARAFRPSTHAAAVQALYQRMQDC